LHTTQGCVYNIILLNLQFRKITAQKLTLFTANL